MLAAFFHRKEPAPGFNVKAVFAMPQEKLVPIGTHGAAQDTDGDFVIVDFGASEVRVSEVRACEVRACEVRACEVRACEVRASEVRASEVRACEVRACEVRACEVRASEVRASEVRACEVRASEVRALSAFTLAPFKMTCQHGGNLIGVHVSTRDACSRHQSRGKTNRLWRHLRRGAQPHWSKCRRPLQAGQSRNQSPWTRLGLARQR